MTEEHEIYTKYLNLLQLKLVKKYDEFGLRASGEYERQLEPVIQGNVIKMLGAKHSGAMEGGIRASNHKYGPVRQIREWLDVKRGLPASFYRDKERMAFAIAKNIAKFGIKVPNQHNAGKVVSLVITDFVENDIPNLIKELGLVWTERMRSDIFEIFEAA